MSYTKELSNEMVNAIIEHGLDNLEGIEEGQEACELHNALYNMDYFIIGYYQAEQFLKDHLFAVAGIIQQYENDNFGEVTTDLSCSEKVANMLAYIVGEELLSNCATISNNWDETLNNDDLAEIREELEAQQGVVA